ncbi:MULTISPECIES: aminotransferase class I/II-fold pyridoxal phosphate-dependent enzyme [unclassified Halomonas]|uniref:pyridoxal phosphate-dependent aminotransferase n=1 Tax=unclassified Halomonas TaxID=2609666 RepID=UPI0028878347|nr:MULTISPECIES: aminotransferase class I/II-fold pyridoxal phosphate-dependent enzyme [unclassified Halomonas]MDT0499549.1 aminotransferase class I/II-fold pyridoxal phosphate-dependent enzyme [Halomonas sp. PAR7]MDT0510634.1 aminotransferase class I/II-fold pyridoxal phosphate-dependent enzyme [Halomonas sp. LES1]MDT0592353.1 aminotransferase class I/II-fold pyridoxal phosphate-dependent enzyme [Halomonas sp. PAR8]
MSRFPDHLTGDGPHNPFPGVRVLERRLGREIPHQLGSNEGLDMPHRALRERFGDALAEHVYSYGDAEALGIRRRLAEQKGIPLEAMLVDAGADSLLALTLRAVTSPGETVVATRGTYPTFAYFARGHGCRVEEVAYDEAPGRLAPDLDALAHTARETRARLVYLANPDNPGGHLHGDEDVLALRHSLPDDCWLLLDEAYHDFRGDADGEFGRRVLPGVVRLRTLSKAHGLAGLRVGYAIAEPETLAMMMKVRIHYAVSTLSQAAAETVLDAPDEVAAHVAAVRERRERLAAHLRELGADVLPSATNFVGVRLPSAELAAEVHKTLLDEGKLIARPADPALGHVLRITAVEDALSPGRLATLERALQR